MQMLTIHNVLMKKRVYTSVSVVCFQTLEICSNNAWVPVQPPSEILNAKYCTFANSGNCQKLETIQSRSLVYFAVQYMVLMTPCY